MSKESNILVVGFGSIGQRHLRLLSEMWKPNVIRLTMDTNEKPIPELSPLPTRTVHSWEEAISTSPEFAIIANPTVCHLETATRLVDSKIPFIIEKPVSDKLDGLDDLQSSVQTSALPVLVGFQLRHHPGYQKFVEVITSGVIGRPLSLQGYVGQYLLSWRPGTDYRQNYSASHEMGGGVIFDLCHEIDIATSVMGKVIAVHCVCGQYSDLEIDSEDVAELILEHENHCISHIHLDYLEPRYRWTTAVIGSAGSVTWDYGGGYVSLSLHDGVREVWHEPVGFERDDLFRAQMQQWLDVLDGSASPSVDLATGIEVTKVAVAAHRSAKEGRRVQI